MNCEDARRLLDELLSDELDTDGLQALRAHASGCDACRADIERALRLMRALKRTPSQDAPDDIVKRVMAEIDPASPPGRGFLPDAIQILFAAFVLALVGSLYPIWQRFATQNVLTRLYFRTVEDGLNFVAMLAHRVADAFGQAGLFVVAVVALVSILAAVELTLRFAHRSE